jgi:glycosyltransferase involved in cell wall biosynthesis
MKILMISPQPFFEPRGTPISVYQRIEALSALGHEIDLITYHVGKDVDIPNLKIHRVRGVKVIQHVRICPSRAKIFLDAQIFFRAIYMLLGKKYDVIHSHEEAAFFGMMLAWVFHVRHLYDMHSVLSNQLTNFSFGNNFIFVKIFEILEKMVLKTSQAVITVGPDLEKYVRSVSESIRVVMIENIALHAYQTPVQLEEVKQLEEELSLKSRLPIVYTGTYERYQGLDMALNCVDEVRKKYPNVIFIFVGAKVQQAQEWTEKADRMGLREHTLFMDVVSPEESMIYLACASVLISPRLDGTSTPLKIYSYLHAEKPIVATRITSHIQVLTDTTALLVEPNESAFADGILRVLNDSQFAHQLGKKAYQLAQEKFGRQDYISKVNQIYKTFLPKAKIEEPILSQEK